MRRLIFLLINAYTLFTILEIPVYAYNRTKTLLGEEVLKNASSMHHEFCSSINVTAMCLTQGNSIKTESSLLMAISKLTEEDFQNVVSLLKSHPELVTVNLFEGSIKLGAITLKYIPDKSLRFYRTALEIAKILNIDNLKAEAYYSLSIVYTILYKIDDAIEALNESRGYYQKVNDKTGNAKTVANLASLYLFKNNYILARDCALKSLEIVNTYHDDYSEQEDYSIAISYSVLAYLLAFDGMNIQSMEYYQRALSLLTRLDRGTDQYALNITEVYSGLGRVYYQLGDYAHSLLMLEQAVIFAGKTHLNDRVAGVYNILGTLFILQENYDKAFEYYGLALRIFQDLNISSELSRVKYNLGIAYQNTGNSYKAFEYFTDSKQMAQSGYYYDVLITSSEGLSVVYKQQGDYDLAMIELRNSEKWALELGDRGRLAEIEWLKARLYQTCNDYQNAITYAKKAILIALDRNDRELIYLASTTLGECYLALKNYELAYQHLVQAIQILEQMRHRIIGQEYEKQLFFEQKTAAYHAMIELLISQNKPLEALKYADKTKARTLNEAMSQGIIERVSGVPSVLMREEKRINLQIMEISRLLREESLKSQPSIANIDKLTEQIASTRKTYLDLQSNSKLLQPELKDEFLSGGSAISPGLKKALSKSSMVILEYVVREDGVYLFAISKSAHDTDISINTFKINITKKELKEKVSDFHDLISKRSVSFRALSRDLYDLLIKPAENDLKSKTAICFVPDDILWNFPFQAAQGSDNRFLLEQYSIYYAPSLNTLSMLSEDIRLNGSHKNLSFLSYANPPVASKDSLIRENSRRNGVFAPLPEAEVEVNKISRLFSKGYSRAIVGEKAVESSFKTLASEYKNIHLATHGVLNNQNPMNSYLLFSDVGDEKNDSLLEAREIANLDLDADMVVLSSCETARGSIRRGEGVVGMAWAFLSAGARSTVVSQWKVDSTATASLMVDFYGNMFRNKSRTRMTRSESLRQASLKLMKDNRYRHPFYWAGFIVIGNNN